MRDGREQSDERAMLRIGAGCAILGAVVSVAAGAGFGNRTTEWDTERLLRFLSSQPSWYWPLVHFGFIVGALLWVCAFVVMARTLPEGVSRSLGRLAVASIIIGATIHVLDSSVDGVGLTALARSWAAAPAAEQPNLLRAAGVLTDALHGTWASVITFFHGLPFVLLGLAVIASRRYPAWLGWAGVVGGAGSLVLGALMFLDAGFGASRLFIAFAIIVSVWMVAMGALLVQDAATPSPEQTRPTARPAPESRAR